MDVSYETDAERAPQIGLIVLQADETIERDMRVLMPDSVEVLVSRVPSGSHVTPESLAAMEANLSNSVALFPAGAEFSAVGYGCTSGTAQIGASGIAKTIRSSVETPHITEPVTALIAASRKLGVQRIGVLSPYIESVSARLCEVLEADGIHVCAFASFNESAEEKVVRIAPQSIIDAARGLWAEAELDALFISCTNLRTLSVIEPLEAEIGGPVLTSNQVLAWHLLERSKQKAPFGIPGQLWRA